MRTVFACVLSIGILFSGSFAFAGEFEGVIHMKSTFRSGADARMSESDWFIKGDHIRTERKAKVSDAAPPGPVGAGAMIFNADTKKGYVIMPERKMYVELSEERFEKTAEHVKDKYEIVRTGKNDTVAGYQCEIIQTKSKETGKIRGESCASKGLGNMGALMGLNRSEASKLSGDFSKELRQLIKEGYFLLRMVTKDEDGSEKMRIEATSVEKKKLDSNLFVPPPDYIKFDMNAIKNKPKNPLEEGSMSEQGKGDSPAP